VDRIVLAVKAGTDHAWLTDAAARLAQQTGAQVAVVSVDGVEVETLSPLPRSEARRLAEEAARAAGERLRAAGVAATEEARAGAVVRGLLVFAEEQDADVVLCGATSRGPVASRLLGSVPLALVQKSRRPVLIISPPEAEREKTS
jgi:nucleotide-binding universal stress UspA family protein